MELLPASGADGFDLAMKSDVLLTQVEADEEAGLGPTRNQVATR